MRRVFLSLSAAALVLLSACGGSSSGTPVPPVNTAAAPTTAATLAPTIAPVPTAEATEPEATEPAETEPAATDEATPEPVETPAETEAAGGSPAALDLCSLLTTAEVAAALKENVMDGAADADSCTWAQADADGTALLLVKQDTVDDFNSIRTITGGVYEVTTVSGLGDDAYVSVVTGTNVVVLYVRKGDNVLQVGVVSDSWTADDETAADTTLAAEAIAGL